MAGGAAARGERGEGGAHLLPAAAGRAAVLQEPPAQRAGVPMCFLFPYVLYPIIPFHIAVR